MEPIMSCKALSTEIVGICRLCATVKKVNSFLTIQQEDHEVCQKLSKCFQIKIEISDSLPKCICHECIQCLNQSFDFYTKIYESQESLSALFPKGNIFCKAESSSTIVNSVETKTCENFGKSSVSKSNSRENHKETFDSKESASKLEDFPEVNKFEVLDEDENKVEEILDPEETFDLDELTTEADLYSEDSEKEIDCNNYNDEEFDISEEVDKDKKANVIVEATKTKSTWKDYNWECTICSSHLPNVSALIQHSQIEHNLEPSDVKFTCIDCLKCFPRYYSLLNHVRHHHRKNLAYICDVCSENYQNFEELASHRSARHDSDSSYPSVIICPVCGKSFWSLSSLNIHSKTHLPDQLKYKSKCSVCGNKFRNENSLKMHMKVHLGNYVDNVNM